MLKQLFALVRGRTHEAGQEVVDRNALVILRQQIRDCADAIAAARRAVAIAIAQNEQEVAQYKRLVARIDDLETRATLALQAGKHELAREAAETIAMLEAERTASDEAQRSFTSEIERLRRIVRSSERRLRDLQRGQRIAAAADKTQRLREAAPGSTPVGAQGCRGDLVSPACPPEADGRRRVGDGRDGIVERSRRRSARSWPKRAAARRSTPASMPSSNGWQRRRQATPDRLASVTL